MVLLQTSHESLLSSTHREMVTNNGVVLVTGASTGLGLALARLLLEKTSYHLVLTARASSLSRFSENGIEENERLWLRPLDIVKDSERRELIAEVNEKLGGVDILINNAGVSYRSVVEHVTEEERLAQMDINFRSPMELIRLVLPSMRKKRKGRIINVSSSAGMMAMPTMAVYSASKFALEGGTEALWYETRPWGIKVTLIQPGFINSSSFRKVHMTNLSARSMEDTQDPYHAHYVHMAPFIEKMMGYAVATPEKIARKILKVMRRRSPPLRVPATVDAILFSLLRRFLPRTLYHHVLLWGLPKRRKWGNPD